MFCSSLTTVKFPHGGVMMMIHFNLHLSSYLLNLLLLRNNTTLEHSNQILNFQNGAIITIVGDKFSYNTCIFLFQLKQSLNFPIYKMCQVGGIHYTEEIFVVVCSIRCCGGGVDNSSEKIKMRSSNATPSSD